MLEFSSNLIADNNDRLRPLGVPILSVVTVHDPGTLLHREYGVVGNKSVMLGPALYAAREKHRSRIYASDSDERLG
jgi:hypothetical protein